MDYIYKIKLANGVVKMPKPHGGKLVDRVLKEEERKSALNKAKRLPHIAITAEIAAEVQNIAHGVFSPLEGFLKRDDYQSVLKEGRLSFGLPWTIPIILDISPDRVIKEGQDIVLAYENKPIALMHVEEIYDYNKKELAKKVFGTTDLSHPGVAKVYGMKELLIGGKIDLIEEVNLPFSSYYLKPQKIRRLFEERNWETVVGFQTRNVPHLGHEYVQKMALTFTDGLFINPVVGKKRRGDFKDEVILKTYEALMENYYPKSKVALSILPLEMRYAGPREAIFHAIVRKNFGCTHFIVGRDHAGVGNFYSPYAAQEIFREFPDLDITPLFFTSVFHCRKCGGVVSEKICPHGEGLHVEFSGTRIRELLLRGEKPPEELMRPEVAEIILKWANPFVN